jgi:hypothetical protein
MRNDDLRLAGFEEPRDSESSRPLLSRQTQSRSAQCVPQTSGRACPLWVIADMCSAAVDVRLGPKADIGLF